MKKLTYEEFYDRLLAINRARRIFVDSGLTNNITTAFALYQMVFAERERDIFISNAMKGDFQGSVMDKYERPLCPECGTGMLFRVLPSNTEGVLTQLVCPREECDTVLNSEHDLRWWMENLKKVVE